MGLERVWDVTQLFVKRESAGICMSFVRATDDLLVKGKMQDLFNLITELSNAFIVEKIEIGGNFRYMGCEMDGGGEIV